MPLGETIVALGTPVGESAIAMVRVTGPQSKQLAQTTMHFNGDLIPRKCILASYVDSNNVFWDEVLFSYFEEKKSYTGESMLEICCHGNPLIVQKIIEDLLKRGCRMAEGGEFTKTAFINGKMDLSQAEAVADLISARSELGISVAQNQLAGGLGKKIDDFVDRLLKIMALVEAYIDFPEEDLPEEEVDQVIASVSLLASDFQSLIDSSNHKFLLQEGIKAVILGAPNAGKSSLLNYLIGEERAIVSPQPGTTRDFIAEKIMLGPYCIRIMDTAGVHDAQDPLEKMGIEKSLNNAQIADFHVVMIDVTADIPTFPEAMLRTFNPRKTLILENKIDLKPEQNGYKAFLEGFQRSRVSLKTREGLVNFKKDLQFLLDQGIRKELPSEVLVANSRHAAALEKSKAYLEEGAKKIKEGGVPELAATDLHLAKTALEEIVGEIDNEKIIDHLFSSFCIGK